MTKQRREAWLRRGAGILCLAGILALVRYAFRWVGPFLLAWASAALGQRPIGYLTEKCHWRRPAAAAVITGGLLLSLAGLLALGIWGLGQGAARVMELLPGLVQSVRDTGQLLSQKAARLSPQVQEGIRQGLEKGEEAVSALPERLAQQLPKTVSAVVAAAPGVLLFAATYGAGTLFLGIEFPAARAFFCRQLPSGWPERLRRIRREAAVAVGAWLKAQVRLMTVTFLLVTGGLWLMGMEGAALIGFGIALVDALPVLGTGTVLIPWALWCLTLGNPVRGAGLGALYLVSVLVRSFLEPKLIGREAGLSPAASLFGMYTGFCLWGVGGMILFPMALMAAKQLQDAGEVRLWK